MIRYKNETKILQRNLSNLQDSDLENTNEEVMIKFRKRV